MQNFARRLMSGASLALLAFGGGSAARASSISVRSQVSSQLNSFRNDELLLDEVLINGTVGNDVTLLEGDQDTFEGHIALDQKLLESRVDVASEAQSDANSRLSDLDLAHSSDLHSEAGQIAAELLSDQFHQPEFADLTGVSFDTIQRGGRQTARAGSDVDASARSHGSSDNNPNFLTNNGVYAASARAYWASVSGNAEAHGTGVRQGSDEGVSPHGARNKFVNSASAVAGGFASASHAKHVLAHGIGVSQYATGSNTGARNHVTNKQLAEISAFARASGAESGSAIATGVHQKASASNSNVGNYVHNSGVIKAQAEVSRITSGKAVARAYGINQDPSGSNVFNSVENFGTIDASAHAQSVNHAHVSAVGIYQSAHATNVATNKVDNDTSGKIEAFAAASQDGTDGVALARGVDQRGEGAPANNYVTNDGVIAAGALASDGIHAVATAQGVHQSAHGPNAKNFVYNNSGGLIVAGADASSAEYNTAHATGVHQHADDSNAAHNNVRNDGSIEAAAFAHGSVDNQAFGNEAYAAGIVQLAKASAVTGNKASNNVDNFGSIFAVAAAYSGGNATFGAHAHATGIYQAAGGYTANDVVHNHGFIGVDAYAGAAARGTASATGVHQVAGNFGKHFVNSANNTVDNTASATIVALATANRDFRGHAYAAGVAQFAFGSLANNSVSNHGFIGASAHAHDGHSLGAHATGIHQYATAFGSSGHANNTVSNYKNGTIVAFAYAYDGASGYGGMDANAVGVYQAADGQSASNFVGNAGFIGAHAHARGTANEYRAGSAFADAEGIFQDPAGFNIDNSVTNVGTVVAVADASFAYHDQAYAAGVGQGAGGSAATNYVSNAGLIAASANAHDAPGYFNGSFHSGHATAGARGITQFAEDAKDVDNTVLNSGTVIAVAHASSANYQNADARGVNQADFFAKTANNFVSNSGFIGASAIAQGRSNVRPAYQASAYAAGVNQWNVEEDGSNTVHNTVINHKAGVIAAYAEASFAYSDVADARGVNQRDYFVNSAHNYVSNDGLIAAGAFAFNTSEQFQANRVSARAYGVDQYAAAFSVHNSVVNHGAIGAFASAYNATHAFADAWGVNQYAAAIQTAANYVSNDGLIVGIANAHYATAENSGAIAHAWGVNQFADPNKAFNTVVNAAGGTIAAVAHAYTAQDQYASAWAVDQRALSASATAQNYVSNDGFIGAQATAHGHITPPGFIDPLLVDAQAFGVDEYASGSPAHNAVINGNKGAIVGLASADYGAFVRAAAAGVFQTAQGHSGLASNYVSNDGIVAGIAIANSGFDFDVATAYGAGQHAEASSANNQVVNGKGAAIGAYANASGGIFVHGYAHGVNQTASAENIANNYVTNDGLIVADAIARGVSHGGPPPETVQAHAWGVNQHAYGSTALNSVANEGTIAAFAHANNASNFVQASASGVYQRLSDASSAFHNNDVHNGGIILAEAYASAAGGAFAHARGVKQTGYGSEWAINSVSNQAHATANGTVHGLIAAVAQAYSANFAEAGATGITQYADGNELSKNGVVNRGEVVALAHAYYADDAFAFAAGVSQYAEADSRLAAANNVSNFDLIAAQATAFGTGIDGDTGNAAARGIEQNAYVSDGTSAGAHNNVFNHHQARIFAFATASGASRAEADARGVEQFADGYTGANYVSNDGGVIEAFAGVHGGFESNFANAYGVSQDAVGHTAKNTVINRGGLGGQILASAFASGTNFVHANAYGVRQFADLYSGLASNLVVNTGIIVGRAHARGQITTTTNFTGTHITDSVPAHNAFAEAYGAEQYASANHPNNAVYNAGLIFGVADASHAINAFARATGVDQYAAGEPGEAHVVTAHNYVSNAGLISGQAHAFGGTYVKGAAVEASAGAMGVDQYASGLHAHNTVDNNGSHHLALIAGHAVAGYAADADAHAWAINQTARAGATAKNVVTNNSGIVTGSAIAYGRTTESQIVNVSARAFGVDQHAFGALAKNTVINNGHYTGTGDTGHVTGVIAAHAHAQSGNLVYASADGVYQDAFDSPLTGAFNYVSNDGGLIHANATALSASQSDFRHVTNTTLHAPPGAYRHSSASGALDLASAQAYGVNEIAHGRHAKNTVLNEGTIAAFASAAEGGYVKARAEGVKQVAGSHSAVNGYTGQNFVSNTGFIQAHAHAHDASGYTEHKFYQSFNSAHQFSKSGTLGSFAYTGLASANAIGVDQSAGAHINQNDVFNNGHVIGALASASNSANIARADARGVNQVAHGALAHNYVDNNALITAQALAFTSSDRFASSDFSEKTDNRTAHAYGVHQYAHGSNNENVVDNSGEIKAYAAAYGADNAIAVANGVYQAFTAVGSNFQENRVDNFNHLISARADAHFAETGNATATGVDQFAHGGVLTLNYVTNNADILGKAHAWSDEYVAGARGDGVHQHAYYGGANENYVENRVYNYAAGYITGSALASATIFDGNTAKAYAAGIAQTATGYSHAENIVHNAGHVKAFASAYNADSNYAEASGVYEHAQGVYMSGTADNHVLVSNHGVIHATAHAHGYCTVTYGLDCGDSGVENAHALGVHQNAHERNAKNTVTNHGNITAMATAKFGDRARAYASGVEQTADGRAGYNVVKNYGTVHAHAKATGGTDGADAYAAGVHQDAFGSTLGNFARDNVYNDGSITAQALANGGAFSDPNAYASAHDVYQQFNARTAEVNDTNVAGHKIKGFASAVVHSGITETADAYAAGISAVGTARGLALDVFNHGTINATATGSVAVGSNVHAQAYGINIVNHYTGNFVNAGYVSDDIYNDGGGRISADAFASHAHGGGQATAVGIRVRAQQFSGEIFNSGSIDAQAFGGTAKATGIRVQSNGHEAYTTTYHHPLGLIVNDGGFIFASTGDAVKRSHNHAITGVVDRHPGVAINVESAPNAIEIVLEGQGQTTIDGVDSFGLIYGDIEDEKDTGATPTWKNSIIVSQGVTYFDGSLNKALDATKATGSNSLDWGGTLTINQSGGSGSPAQGILWLPSGGTSFWGSANGNPVLNVNTFTQQPNAGGGVIGGTIWLGISSTGSATINAETAHLGGSVYVIADSYSLFVNGANYDVVDSPSPGGISGSWSTVAFLPGTWAASSPLLSLSAPTPSATDADITLNVLAFNLVPGLTHNQQAVGLGLEGGYAGCVAGPVSAPCQAFYQAIFQFTGPQYPGALDMLSDSQAGEVAQSNVESANNFVDMIQGRMASMAGVLGAGGQIPGGGQDGHGITLWGSPYGTWDNTSSSASGPGYANSRGGVVLGADVAIDPTAFVGVAGDIENKSSLDFKNGRWADYVDYAGRGTSKGWDIALYGRWNGALGDTPVYLQGSGSYGTYDDTTRRQVVLPLLPTQAAAPAGASPGRSALTPGLPPSGVPTSSYMSASFSSDVWSVYGEGGVPLDLGVGFTPYFGMRYLNSSSGAFGESSSNGTPGIAAAALNVTDAKAQSFTSYLGAEFSGELPMGNSQSLLPSLRLAWAHNFSDPWKVDAYFSGVGPSSAFEIDASSWSRDSGIIDAGLSMLFTDNLLGTIGYDASLNSTQTVQSAYGRVDFKF